MFKPLKSTAFTLLLLALAPAIIAQGTCPAIVDTALAAVDELCTDTGRNQACYGHFAIDAVPQADAPAFTFEKAGDITDVSEIEMLRLQPMDETNQTWGVALMRLQANLPGTLPGQNVTFLLFGDVEITNEVPADGSDEYTPMQAFQLRTGLGDSQCDDAPESGLMVQAPQGTDDEVTFNINGVDVGIGSTVIFQAEAEGDLTVSTIEGTAVLELDDEVQPVVQGTRLRVPLGQNLRPLRRTFDSPEPYNEQRLRGLPTRLLQRPVDVHPPLTKQQVRRIMTRAAAGEPLCGEGPLPSCDKVPKQLIARTMKKARGRLEERLDCVFRRGPHETPLSADETRPFCDQLPPEDLPCVFLPGPGDPPLPADETRLPCPQIPEQTVPAVADGSPPVLPPLPDAAPPRLRPRNRLGR